MDCLAPIQSGFRLGYITETALVALVDKFRRDIDSGRATLSVLLDLSAAFKTIDHHILLGHRAGLRLEVTVGGSNHNSPCMACAPLWWPESNRRIGKSEFSFSFNELRRYLHC